MPRIYRLRVAALLLAASGIGSGLYAQPNADQNFVGAETCGSCHTDQFARQSQSGHAQALYRVPDHPLASSFLRDSEIERKPAFRYQFVRTSGPAKVRVTDGDRTIETPLEWAFGSGDQGITFVSQINEETYLEHYLSYYSAIGALAPTAGQHEITAKSVPEAMGVFYQTFGPRAVILGCFDCHSTGPVSLGLRQDIQPSERGVRCESCHGPGREHVDAMARNQIEAARALIRNPGRLSPAELSHMCGECHRPPASEEAGFDFLNPWHVRHQPPYLSRSACFQRSGGSLSCITCHDPHERIRRNDEKHYSRRCTGCHEAATHPATTTAGTVQSDACITCHMPTVAPQEHLRFTNHWIGVYDEQAKLAPLQRKRGSN